jgi:hypothetical protein
VASQSNTASHENVEALLIGDSYAEVTSILSGSTFSLMETLHVALASGVNNGAESLEVERPRFVKPLPTLQYFKVSYSIF